MSRVVGYCRISTKSQIDNNSIEQQSNEILERYSDAEIVEEQFTGKTTDRPKFNELLKELEDGDLLVVTKLDRFCRSTEEGLRAIKELKDKGVNVHILNMGLIENTAIGDLIVTNLLAFAQFERAMIIERTQTGKAIAKTKEGFKEGRPKAYTDKTLNHALSLLSVNGGDKSYNEVVEITGISRSTLMRENQKRKSKVKEEDEDIAMLFRNLH